MSALFASASSQYLKNATAPVTVAPWTVSFWSNTPSAASEKCLWCLTDTAGASDGWALYKRATSNLIIFGCYSSVAYEEAACATAVVSNAPTFVVVRGISATNRKVSVLHATGAIDPAQNTNSVTPAGIDTVALGAEVQSSVGVPMDGMLAEYAMWNVDVQGDGAALQASTLRQMAYGGPFSMTHVLGNLVEYRSLRSSLVSASDRPNEIYLGAGKTRQVWTNTGGATLGPHPPLGPRYVKQFQGNRLMPVL